MDWTLTVLLPLAGYLVGSIPFGYLVARARGIDIFEHGSGNIGATNVGRVLGRPFGVLVFVLDFAKGALPVAVAGAVAASRPDLDAWWRPGALEVLTGLAAFLGHLFPIFLGLRGGKGVATGTGVVAVLMPGPALAALAVWVVTVVATRYVSVASILAACALAAARLGAAPGDWADPRTAFALLAGALVVLKHRTNFARLLAGHENQLRENLAMTRLARSLHVLAVGLWFGTAVFFSFVVGLSLFGSFERLGESAPRPAWFPPTPAFVRSDDAIHGPREQGSRAAGFAVAPMFAWYFLLQGACGFLALVTAVPWARRGGVHRWRLSLLLAAILLVIAGWPVEQYVSELRGPRNRATDAYLQAPEPTAELRAAMQSARGDFGKWHGVSLLLNLATIALVTAATALAAHLPGDGTAITADQRTASAPTGDGLAATAARSVAALPPS